jgi:hypothetical protein
MFKKLGSLFVLVLGLLLLGYSASRSIDFIMLTLPADRQILAWFGLAALDGGLIAWLLAYLYGSRGGWQRGISLLMVIVDLAGAVVMFTADTLYNSGQKGLTVAFTPEEMQTFILALSGIIGLNIASVVAHHMTDPEKMKAAAEEEAFSTIEDAALKAIRRNSDQLAAELAVQIADDWTSQTRARYQQALGTGSRLLPGVVDGHTVTKKNTDQEEEDQKKKKRARPVYFSPFPQRLKSVHYNSETADPLPVNQAGSPNPTPGAGRK